MKLLELLLLVTISASGAKTFIPDKKLLAKCQRRDADSCANLAALTFPNNPTLAKTYYKKACELGKTSSCVFVGGKVESGDYIPDGLEPWYQKNLRYFVDATLYPTITDDGVHFTTRRCRELISKAIDGQGRRKVEFSAGCDVSGEIAGSKVGDRHEGHDAEPIHIRRRNGEGHRVYGAPA